jgi:hypothetical protein
MCISAGLEPPLEAIAQQCFVKQGRVDLAADTQLAERRGNPEPPFTGETSFMQALQCKPAFHLGSIRNHVVRGKAWAPCSARLMPFCT